MHETLLRTKLFIPQVRPNLVPRPQLIEQLDQGLVQGCKLILISAPAGYGKTTLVSEWVHTMGGVTPLIAIAWLSLDEGDNDPTRFVAHVVAALQTIEANIGKGALCALQSPQRPPTESMLTALLNEVVTIPDSFVLVLDDYHVIDSKAVDDTLTFLIEHLPPQMHLVIATREDPQLPLARLRARSQLTELRVTDLRFTPSEAAEFLNRVMDLNLSADDIAALETRTEGWIAGLQLAAVALQGPISMQGHKDATSFIKSFTGSHHFVLDYLVEEVLHLQSEDVQTFLLHTSILERLCGPLCDAILRRGAVQHPAPSASGQETLEYLAQANLFIVPLDTERRWYRYHHLFADLLRKRLYQATPSSTGNEGRGAAELHRRASRWYEHNGLEIEAFQHAAAANDIKRAERLIDGGGVPLQYRGAAVPALNWLASQPTTVLDARPSLWVTYASALNLTGQPDEAERKLQAAEAALQDAEPNDKTNDTVGHIAAVRAMIATGQNQVETIIAQSRRALAYLHPDNLTIRTIITWTLGRAYQLQGDRSAASQAYFEVLSISQASGDIISALAANTGLGSIQESENQLYLAAESYRRGLQLFGDQLQSVACETCLGLARIHYEWNDLEAALQLGQQSLQLAQQVDSIDTFAVCDVFLARLKLIQGDAAGATGLLVEADRFMRQHHFVDRMPEVAAAQVLVMLHRGDLAAAAQLAETHELPICQARVHLAQGNTSAALAILEPLRRQVEARGLENERLKVTVLQAVTHHAHGQTEEAVQMLGEALALAEPGGFIRTFVDEGPPMARLLYEALARGISPENARRLLAHFPDAEPEQAGSSKTHDPDSEWIETLSEREIEVLQLISKGLTNQEIATKLYLSLHTVKVHARNIYGKLGVKNRTQAVAKGRALGFLSPT